MGKVYSKVCLHRSWWCWDGKHPCDSAYLHKALPSVIGANGSQPSVWGEQIDSTNHSVWIIPLFETEKELCRNGWQNLQSPLNKLRYVVSLVNICMLKSLDWWQCQNLLSVVYFYFNKKVIPVYTALIPKPCIIFNYKAHLRIAESINYFSY